MQHIALLLAGGLVAAGFVVLIVSPRARRELGGHLKRGVTTLKDNETRKSEQAVLVVALLLIASGSVVPGPFDEILGVVIIARVVQRVDKRKKGES